MTEAARKIAMRRYRTRFIAAMVCYSVLIVVCFTLLKSVEPWWGKMLLALIPVAPVVYALGEILRLVRSLDELERQVQMEAVVIAAVAICLLTFAWGLLEKAGMPKLPVVLVLPLFCAVYGLAVCSANWRYR
jgi:hypothetical protein